MPDILGKLKPPRLSVAPSSPALGEMYYDTVSNVLLWWDGTKWNSSVGVTGAIYDTDQVGTVKTWTGTTIPTNWAIADGSTLTEAAGYTDLATFAAAEVAAGNTLWGISGTAPNRTITLPDLRDRFILAAGASRTRGTKSQTNPTLANPGEETHTLLGAESGQKAVSTDVDSPDHQHAFASNPLTDYSGGTTNMGALGGGAGVYKMPSNFISGAQSRHTHALAASSALNGHNNMPPYVVLAQIVKVKGVQVSAGGALQGATGPPGTVYDSDQIGVVKSWTGKTVPTNWALANGSTLAENAGYPDLATFAAAEVAAGNPLWAISGTAPNRTITLPDLRDRFILGPGASRAIGTKSQTNPAVANPGEENHQLLLAESPSHNHMPPGYTGWLAYNGAGQAYGVGGPSPTFPTQVGIVPNTVIGSDGVHNNMPPYIVLAQIVKVKGPMIDAGGALVGPTGPQGIQGLPGPGVPTGGTANQVLKKNTATDYDTSWAAPSGGSGLPEVSIGTDPPTPRTGELLWIDTDAVAPTTLNINIDTWHTVGATGEPAFQNGWQSYDAGASFQVPQFSRDPSGRVMLRGSAKGGTTITTGSVMFTLPAGYRPPKQQRFGGVESGTASPTTAWQQCNISPDGTVYAIADSNGIFSLDGIFFDTDTVLQTASVAAQPLDTWHRPGQAGEPTFQNSWSNFDAVGNARNVRFRKYPDGRVRIAGVCQGGASGTVVFTLPVGYRPAAGLSFLVDASNNVPALANVVADGTILLTNIGASAVGTWTFLDTIEFDTESVTNYATAVVQQAVPPRVTSLPVAPVDGQECYFVADSANGVVWHLRYNAGSASAYKWEVVGGGELTSYVGAAETTSSPGYANLATVGPDILVPLAGDYIVRWGAGAYNNVGAYIIRMGVANASVSSNPLTQDILWRYNNQSPGSAERRITMVGAGHTMRCVYASDASNAAYYYSRYMTARPVRVG